jgi:hypothetical protein
MDLQMVPSMEGQAHWCRLKKPASLEETLVQVLLAPPWMLDGKILVKTG